MIPDENMLDGRMLDERSLDERTPDERMPVRRTPDNRILVGAIMDSIGGMMRDCLDIRFDIIS